MDILSTHKNPAWQRVRQMYFCLWRATCGWCSPTHANGRTFFFVWWKRTIACLPNFRFAVSQYYRNGTSSWSLSLRSVVCLMGTFNSYGCRNGCTLSGQTMPWRNKKWTKCAANSQLHISFMHCSHVSRTSFGSHHHQILQTQCTKLHL